jgi:predicted transcriptional regulator
MAWSTAGHDEFIGWFREWVEKDPKTHNQVALARLLGRRQQTVSEYLSRKQRPGEVTRRRIRRVCGIHEDTWLTEEERASIAA